jgi:threonine dehydratase
VGQEKLFLKLENLQVTGAYKPRAAFTVMNALAPEALAKGVVLASSGNFAQAFAFAGAMMDAPIVVVMLERTSRYKVQATTGFGAEVVFCGNDPFARQPTVLRIAEERGMNAIDTWENPMVATGHGSLGLEIIEDLPEVETILVPVSSGGVAAGVATACKLSRLETKVIGVQPERANAAYVSLKKGEPTTIDYWDSMADGLSAVYPGRFPFRHLQKYLDQIVLVSEREIAEAFRTLLFRGKILAEPAGAVAAAAFLGGKVDTSRKTVACVTGGNLTEETAMKLLSDSRR